jgi:hypothetical protein
MDALLQHRPERAAAILAAMRPPQRRAQLVARAEIAEAPPALVEAPWAELLRRPDDRDDPPLAAPIEPETLALMEPDEAQAAVAALSPAQRARQAVAQAAWLAAFGYPVGHAEILASWEAVGERQAT